MKIETKAIHLGHEVDPLTGAIAAPLHLSTTFEREADGSYPRGHIYTRLSNPNRDALEKCLAGLEGGEGAVAFASGLAAIMNVFQALSPNDHVIASQDLYHGTTHILQDILEPWGLQVSFVDVTDLDQLEGAIQENTKIIYFETPSNPLLKITDISRVAAIAHRIGALCVCDNTWPTPILQRPLELGADIVVHSTTKYFGGHSDVLGGAVISKVKDAFFDRIRMLQQIGGAVPAPFDCWLVLRGIQTLCCRMKNHSESAFAIAKFLDKHPNVEKVYYPGLANHPGHDIVLKQMSQFGGMLSFQIKGDKEEALAFTGRLRIIRRATSLGGVESLIEHRASIEGPQSKTPDNLLRFSVGLENVDDLLTDLDEALTKKE
ncbi:PLP-dependent aspartate aminotransferase family protein [Pelosinus sp. IPA-1]|uniref:trans-sulfuration enzyme family protein n=1 Tax=Pelosinus sp. IPA-1 TaxID=3029569 RepID=UPI00243629CB|nr:PLP-dependent aspartate aminotransferase family protein [Pelosinus sp. IPA-1]GMA97416.1 cystathionine gamma-synthase [Pelosinus sp. IPA-1]